MTKSTNSYRTTQKNKDALKEKWGSVSAGTGRAVDAYVNLRGRVLDSLNGKFTRAELSALIDRQNGLLFEAKFAVLKDAVIAGLQDAQKFDNLSAKWEIDFDALMGKIEALPVAELFFLQEEIDRFWNDDDRDLESFLDRYAKNE